MRKKLLSAFMAAVMIFTSIGPLEFAAGAEGSETDPAAESQHSGNSPAPALEVTGSNSFGSMLTANVEPSEITQAANSACAVTNLKVEGKAAAAALRADRDAQLVIGIYTEDGTQLITSATAPVKEGDRAVGVEFSEDLPKYFTAKAFLIDPLDMKSLCREYENIDYTEKMQKFDALTTEDFDSDRVIKTFDSINGEGTLTIKKALSGANIGTATLAYDLAIAKKIVVPAITGNLTIAADEIKSGTTIFQYTGKAAFDGSKVTISDGSLEAFAYKKDVRAMQNGALTVDGTDYPDFEQAFAAMQLDKEYTVVLNGDVTTAKLTLPKTVKKLTIDGCGNTVNIEGALSLTPKYMFEMKNLYVKANKGGTSQAVTINAQGSLQIDDVTFDAKSVTLKGKGALELGDTSKLDTVSGFTTAKITGAVAIAKSMAVPTIELTSTAVVTLDGKNATVTAKTKFSGEEGSQLVLKPGFKAITLSATESAVTGNVILNTDAISGTVQVFATKIPAAALAKVFAPTKGELIAGKSGKVDIKI